MTSVDSDSELGSDKGEKRTLFKVNLVVADHHSCARGACRYSMPAGPDKSFMVRLKVFPWGTNNSGDHCPYLGAFLEMLPPQHADVDWSCEEITFSIKLQHHDGNQLHTVHKEDTHTFSGLAIDRGWRRFLPWSSISEQNEIRVEGEACLPVPKVPVHSIHSLDLTQEPAFVKFLLPDSPPIYCDKRLLTARSEYFAEMFSSQSTWKEARINEVDMRSDPEAKVRSISAIYFFLVSDTFHAQDDMQHALSVRRLADRFCLTSLVDKVDCELRNMLCTENALDMLSQVAGTGGVLEQACHALIKANNFELLEKKLEQLDIIAQSNPILVRQLFRLFVAARKETPRH